MTPLNSAYSTTVLEESTHPRDRTIERVNQVDGDPRCPAGYAEQDRQPDFEWVRKERVNVDPRYQREPSKTLIMRIAKEWSWMACVAIGVCRRDDGSLWVYDGQTRLSAAKMRPDITSMPCMITPAADLRAEAMAFYTTNTHRKAVLSLKKFEALLIAGDPNAIAVQRMIVGSGYRIYKGGHETPCLYCISAVMKGWLVDREVCEAIWPVVIELHEYKRIHDRVFIGMHYVERWLRKHGHTIVKGREKDALLRAGLARVEKKMTEAQAYRQKSGEKVYADAIISVINYKRSRGRIPSPLDA